MAIIIGVLLLLRIYFIDTVYAVETNPQPKSALTKQEEIINEIKTMRKYTIEQLPKYPLWNLVSKEEFSALLERNPEYKPVLQHLLDK